MTIKTIDLQGKKYAQVKDRLAQFRADAPNGSISTDTTYNPDGTAILKATIIFDLALDGSKRATGQSFGKLNGQKAFEKLETIAVGRALALLGYLADGEIASSDEMEEFLSYKDNQKQEAITKLKDCKKVDELKSVFLSLGNLMSDPEIIKIKDEIKGGLK